MPHHWLGWLGDNGDISSRPRQGPHILPLLIYSLLVVGILEHILRWVVWQFQIVYSTYLHIFKHWYVWQVAGFGLGLTLLICPRNNFPVCKILAVCKRELLFCAKRKQSLLFTVRSSRVHDNVKPLLALRNS